jgi:hypothetical protein
MRSWSWWSNEDADVMPLTRPFFSPHPPVCVSLSESLYLLLISGSNSFKSSCFSFHLNQDFCDLLIARTQTVLYIVPHCAGPVRSVIASVPLWLESTSLHPLHQLTRQPGVLPRSSIITPLPPIHCRFHYRYHTITLRPPPIFPICHHHPLWLLSVVGWSPTYPLGTLDLSCLWITRRTRSLFHRRQQEPTYSKEERSLTCALR